MDLASGLPTLNAGASRTKPQDDQLADNRLPAGAVLVRVAKIANDAY
jgi:hypothetical protein